MAFETILLAALAFVATTAAFLFGRLTGARRGPAPAAAPVDTRLIATAAHEMRTPLSGVVGAADLLLESGLSPEQRTYAEAISGSARGMLALVDELVDLSRLEAGAAGLESAAVPVAGLVEEIAELLAPRAQAKGLDFAVLVGPDAPDEIVGDAARLRQILLNLAGNAIKFTASGGVGLRVDRAADGLRFSVTDTGPGFDPKERERLFQEFGRAAEAPAGGAGLGLAISRRLATAMGGSLSAESQPGVGSIFALTLPCWGRDDRDAEAEPLKGRRVLVVSSQPFSGPWLVESLAAAGAGAALASPRDAPPGADDRPDLAIVDRAAGADLAALAELGRGCGAARLILMLSPAERGDLAGLAEAGFDGYLVKPLRAASLVKLVADDAEAQAAPDLADRAPAVSFPASGGLKVLVAEDDPVSALIALAHLSRLGHASVHVADGSAAFEAFARDVFDVVVMDLRMPGLDGDAAARRMRALEREGGRAPALVLALTADAGATGEAEAARAAGFDHVLAKPLDRRAFEALIEPVAAQRARAA